VDEKTCQNVTMFIRDPVPNAFMSPKQAIKLDNVKQLIMRCNESKKKEFLKNFYRKFGRSQAMIFVNKKDSAEYLSSFING
jgi:superfamily II DNA/RNA helicase